MRNIDFVAGGPEHTDILLELRAAALEATANAVVITDHAGNVVWVNSAFEKLTGYQSAEIVGHSTRALKSGVNPRRLYEDMWRTILVGNIWRGELVNRRKDGSLYDEEMTITPVLDAGGEITHYIAIKLDISARRRAEARMAHLANYDALTDLPNRVLLMDRLNQLTKAAQRSKSRIAVVFIDLDRFKEVNDSLGHDTGDLLLQALAKRLSKLVREEDTVARIGGDEFVVVFPELHDVQNVKVLMEKLLSCFIKPVTLNGYDLTVTASLGVSLYPDDAANGTELIRNADAAMYQAKSGGRNTCQFYTSDLSKRALEMLSLENDLRRAIEREEFELYYQPQIDVRSGVVVGAEALIRWHHPYLGLLAPGKFISIAEERGLIVPIGKWVIEAAARQARAWKNTGISIPIAVNVSAVQFRLKNFVEQLANSVRQNGIAANQLNLELTESIIMRDAEATIEVLERLNSMGFTLSIDDFGTGYSSLSYLRQFPISKIKIDRSFMADALNNENGVTFIAAIIGLARSLKLKVIAEGVETMEQLEMLRAQHCDEAQGFLFSPGLTCREFETLVRDWKPK